METACPCAGRVIEHAAMPGSFSSPCNSSPETHSSVPAARENNTPGAPKGGRTCLITYSVNSTDTF